MMAEALREEGEDGERQYRSLRDRSQTADHLERTKSEHLLSRQRSLSSIRAAIKRTQTSSQSNNNRQRRRPEITVISAEPLASNNWFSGGSVVFSPPQSDWSAGTQAVSSPPPSYDQVIKEKTQEEHIVRPTAAPRRTTCTATSSTQTDPVGVDVISHCETLFPAERRAAGKKPQKPPRPFLPKGADRKPAAASANTLHQSDLESDTRQHQHTDASNTCTRSVTVHWDIPTNHRPAEITPSNSGNNQRPVPHPRIKSLKQATEDEAQVNSLVKFSKTSDNIYLDSQEPCTNKHLQELLDVSSEDKCEQSSDIVEQSDKRTQGEDDISEMNSNNSQRNIHARIQAFESQAGNVEGDVFKSARPDLLPRRATIKPQVAAKPLLAFKSQSIDDNNQNKPTTQSFTPTHRPQPPIKPVGLSVREELETLHSKGAFPLRPRPSLLTRDNSIHEEKPSLIPPIPPIKPPKEPLQPNLNINNHNSTFTVRENLFVDSPSNNAEITLEHNMESIGGSFARQSVARRPTTIRVPSKTGLDHFQDSPLPPLPVQKPVGSLNTSVNLKQSLQNCLSTDPPLPPRKPSVKKTLPPRPSPSKKGPGRPPPPKFQAVSRSPSLSWQPSPELPVMKPQRKGLVLPPRPSPGHRLYNKYTLELPHGIATFDYNGNNAGELSFQKNEVLLLLEKINHNEYDCQVGDVRGRVHKSRMKIITPLDPDSSPLQDAGFAASDGDAGGMKVQAVFDFIKEGPEELGLRAGDVVTGVEHVDSQWYRGTCRGSTGFFPVNFVKVLSNSPKPLPERKTKPQSAPASGPRCVARFDFEGEHSSELSFSEGDVIQLKEYVGEDWARGQTGVAVGIFPLNFVDIIEDLPPPPSQQQPNKMLPGMAAAAFSVQPEAATPAYTPESGVEWGVALYDYVAKSENDLSFQQGDCILITRHVTEEWSCGRLNGREGMFPKAFVETNTGQQFSENHQNETARGRKGRALYNFASYCEEELTLQVGDVITNLESIDDEWLLGDSRGKRGLVPKNYVKIIE